MISSRSSFSSSSRYGFLYGEADSSSNPLVNALFARIADFSKSPPIPTPTINGGQALGPASLTVSIIAFLIPSSPSAGLSMKIRLIFSLPNPLGETVILTLSPGTIFI